MRIPKDRYGDPIFTRAEIEEMNDEARRENAEWTRNWPVGS